MPTTETSEKPDEAPQGAGSTLAMGSGVWRVLGILLGISTFVSLIKNGFHIEVYGLPAKLLQEYTWLRDMLFWPVVEVLDYFGLMMPWWAKDALVGYGVVGSAHGRAFRRETISKRLLLAALWPLHLIIKIRILNLRIEQYDYFRYASGPGALTQLIIIVTASALFFLWNYLQNVFGPG